MNPRPRYPSAESREATRQTFLDTRRAAEAKTSAHLAKYGPHTCKPNPADPWSVCALEEVQ